MRHEKSPDWYVMFSTSGGYCRRVDLFTLLYFSLTKQGLRGIVFFFSDVG